MTDDEIKAILRDKSLLEKYLPNELSLHHVVAEGGQGIVYRGVANGQEAALKFYFPGQVEKRVDREVEALRDIDHPNIVKLLWDGELNFNRQQVKVAACEFINGEELNNIIYNNPFTDDQLTLLAFDITLAIQQLWNFKIVHRDLKPANILIRNNGRACVIDLGYARYVDKSTQTALGQSFGTPGYLSPEQQRCVRQLTYKSDLYTLGIIIVEAFLGFHPTMRDQSKLFALELFKNLPSSLEKWPHSNLLKSLFYPIHIRRPTLEKILNELAYIDY